MIESRYFLIDLATGGVLYSTPTQEVMVGLLGAFIDVLPYQLSLRLSPMYRDWNFEEEALQFSYTDHKFYPLPAELRTQAFLEKQKMAVIKARFVEKLVAYCEIARATVTLGVSPQIYSDLEVEIRLCRPEEGYFTPAIHEYAATMQIAPAICVEELKMKTESARLLRIRNFAIYQKYLELIQTKDFLDAQTFFEAVRTELFLNSHV